MNLGQEGALTALNAIAALYNNATLNFYSGMMPGTPEGGVSGSSVLLATFTFAATAFPTPIFDFTGFYKVRAVFVANPVTPVASGTASFARVTSGGNSLEDRTVGQTWQAGVPVVQGQFAMAGANTYMCVTAGTTAASGAGPSGNGMNIPDGTAYWQFWNPGSPDILLTSTGLSSSAPLTLPYFWLAMPCK